jgi:peptide deformylase
MILTDKTLKTIAKDVVFDKPMELQKIGVQLMHLMTKEGGIGLSATQVGLDIRLFVTKVGGEYTAFYNPTLLDFSDDMIDYDEGCLSFKDENHIVSRPSQITVEYYDYLGIRNEKDLKGLAARVWLHEYDHLNGIVFQQRVTNTNIPESMQYVKK